MAGSAHWRFPLIRNNSSCKTPEADYPRAFLQASEVSHPAWFSKKTTRGLSFRPWMLSLPAWLSKKTTQGLSFIPWVFSPPPILPKKSTRWPSSRPWKLSLPAWLSKKTTQGVSFKPRKSHILPYFRRSVPKGSFWASSRFESPHCRS